jgi:hypothetical protein
LPARHSSRASNATLLARIEEVREELRRQEQRHEDLLRRLDKQESEVDRTLRIAKINEQLGVQEASDDVLLALAKSALGSFDQVKGALLGIGSTVGYVQVMVSNTMYLRSLDPTKELPVNLEDALGHTLPLPKEWLEDWDWAVSATSNGGVLGRR